MVASKEVPLLSLVYRSTAIRSFPDRPFSIADMRDLLETFMLGEFRGARRTAFARITARLYVNPSRVNRTEPPVLKFQQANQKARRDYSLRESTYLAPLLSLRKQRVTTKEKLEVAWDRE